MGEITSYPSVLLMRGNGYDAVSRGFVLYETIATRFEEAMRDLRVPLRIPFIVPGITAVY